MWLIWEVVDVMASGRMSVFTTHTLPEVAPTKQTMTLVFGIGRGLA